MRVRVDLEKGQSVDEAEELLYKALDSQRSGDAHSEGFADSAVQHASDVMRNEYVKQFDLMMQEVLQALDEGVDKSGHT